jgi:hypothetical protein
LFRVRQFGKRFRVHLVVIMMLVMLVIVIVVFTAATLMV